MKKIGIFGGTFNPIHKGHIHLAQQYLKVLDLDELLIIPAKYPPHKQAHDLASSEDRLNMCKLAFRDMPKVTVSDLELKRPGKSFTIDTLEELQKQYPDARFYLMIGGDMFRSFEEWHRFRDVLGSATICTAAREEGEYPQLERARQHLSQYSENLMILKISVLEISSTKIREKLFCGEDCSALLPEEVERYIMERNLYRRDLEHEKKVEQYTQLIRGLLKPERFQHSLNVAQRAMYLADLYGEDRKKAEIAGLLHDLCKNMQPQEQLHWMKKSGIIFDKTIFSQPQLWHGFAAAEYLREELSIDDVQIQNAVRYHTVGRANMSTLEKIIYLADLTSQERTYPSVEEVRKTVDRSLDDGMKVSLLFTVGNLLKNEKPICMDTCAAYNQYVGGAEG